MADRHAKEYVRSPRHFNDTHSGSTLTAPTQNTIVCGSGQINVHSRFNRKSHRAEAMETSHSLFLYQLASNLPNVGHENRVLRKGSGRGLA